MAKVSIIVPNFNHLKYLPQRFDSIFSQTFQNFEVIILDDCSIDGSRELIEQYRNHPKVSHIVYNEMNGGTSYKQWDKGIELAKGDLIWIAESDDWCDLRFLEVVVPYFSDKDVAITYTNSQFILSNEEIIPVILSGKFQKYNGDAFISEQLLEGNKLFNASMLVFRRDRYLTVKNCGFLEMRLSGDWLLWTNMIHGYSLVSIPDSLNYFRRHGYNTTSRFRKLGYDFLEGLVVYSTGKHFCKNKFKRKKVYLKWIDYYKLFSVQFEEGVKYKVFKKMVIIEPFMFLYLVHKLTISLIYKYISTKLCP